jgi:hypothetical protein
MYEEFLAGLGRPLMAGTDDAGKASSDTEQWNRGLLEEIEMESVREVDVAEEEALRSFEVAVPEAGPMEIGDCYA